MAKKSSKRIKTAWDYYHTLKKSDQAYIMDIMHDTPVDQLISYIFSIESPKWMRARIAELRKEERE